MTTNPLYAAIDFGTGSLRLTIARVNPSEEVDVMFYKNINHQLGEELAREGCFSGSEMERVVADFKDLKAVLDDYGVANCAVAGTESVRGSANGEDFIQLLKQRTGFDMQILDDAAELHYSLIGCKHLLKTLQGPTVFMDSGGGSSEVALIEPHTLKVEKFKSLKFGVTSLGQRLAGKDVTSPAVFDALVDEMALEIEAVLETGMVHQAASVFMAGAPFYLIRYHHSVAEEGMPAYDGTSFSYEEMERMGRDLSAMGHSGRAAHAYISPVGARWLVPAVAKCLALMKAAGHDELVLAQSGVTRGLLRTAAREAR